VPFIYFGTGSHTQDPTFSLLLIDLHMTMYLLEGSSAILLEKTAPWRYHSLCVCIEMSFYLFGMITANIIHGMVFTTTAEFFCDNI